MELNFHDVIKGPRISDKAHLINKNQKKLVLEVHLCATKSDIRLAVQRLFKVVVEAVRTLILKKKKSKGLNRRRRVSAPSIRKIKIAYVSLAEGYEVNLLEQAQISTTDKTGGE